jgi:hypothetical protein
VRAAVWVAREIEVATIKVWSEGGRQPGDDLREVAIEDEATGEL